MFDENYKYIKNINSITDKTIMLIQSDNISNLDQISCSISYLNKSTEYTKAVCDLIERYLGKFKIVNNLVVEPQEYAFKHAEIYNLIFPNLHHMVFEFKVKNIFKKYENVLLVKMQRHIFQEIIFKQSGYESMKSIKLTKDYPKFESLEHLREKSHNQLTKSEGNTLEFLLKNLISRHSNYTNQLKEALINLTYHILPSEEIEKVPTSCYSISHNINEINNLFLLAPVKGFERCLVKLKEQIQKDPHFKFPLYTLKDISRCSFVFRDASSLVRFFDDLLINISSTKEFTVYETKNMFAAKGGDKYSYKDIKLVCGYQATPKVCLTFEIQLILSDILKLKKTLHKFYDITRTNFTPLRNEYFQLVAERLGEMAVKKKLPEYGEGHLIYELMLITSDIQKFIVESIGKGTYKSESKMFDMPEYIYENEGNIFSKTGGIRPKEAAKPKKKDDEESSGEIGANNEDDEEAIFSICPYGSKDSSEMLSVSPNFDDEDDIFFLVFLYRAKPGESKCVYEQEGHKFNINTACIRMAVEDGNIVLEYYIFRAKDNEEVDNENEYIWKVEVNKEGKTTTEFNVLVYTDGEFSFENVGKERYYEILKKCNYIREFDIYVARKEDLEDKSDVESQAEVDVNKDSEESEEEPSEDEDIL